MALSGRSQLALEWSEKALALAQLLNDEKQVLVASTARGAARCDLGDLGGLEDSHSAVQAGLRLGLVEETLVAYSNLTEWTWWIEGPASAAHVYGDFMQFVERRGLVVFVMHAKAEFLRVLFDLGEWDEILRSAGDLLRWSEDHGNQQTEATVLLNQAQVLLLRGRIDQAAALEERLVELAHQIEDLQVFVPALIVAGLIEQAQGHAKQAVALVTELDHLTTEHHGWRARFLPSAVRILISAGQLDEADEFLAGMVVSAARDQHSLLTGRAILAEARDEIEQARHLYQQAAQRWADYGFVLEEGQAHLGLARCLIALGDREGAPEPLQKARVIFSWLGARPLIDEVDRHLVQATAQGA